MMNASCCCSQQPFLIQMLVLNSLIIILIIQLKYYIVYNQSWFDYTAAAAAAAAVFVVVPPSSLVLALWAVGGYGCWRANQKASGRYLVRTETKIHSCHWHLYPIQCTIESKHSGKPKASLENRSILLRAVRCLTNERRAAHHWSHCRRCYVRDFFL